MSFDYGLVVSLLAAVGVGSVLTTLLQNRFQKSHDAQKQTFQEKREAYIGLLEALQRAAVEPNDKNSKAFAYWQTRCELVGSNSVCRAVQAIIDTNDDQGGRQSAYRELLAAMRSDLGIGRLKK